MPPRIIIVGAGISGLSAAFRIREHLPAAQITILEQADRAGGTAWTLREDGFQLEMGPNGFLDNKPTTIGLTRDVGLGQQLIQASEAAGKNRYLFLGDGLRALPHGFSSLLGTPLLSWRGKLSLLWERFRAGRGDAGDESIDTFARRRAGNEVAEVFADALVTGIYAGDLRQLSLAACFPRIAELERNYGSIIKGFGAEARKRRAEAKALGKPYERPGKMWSFAGGLRVLIEQLTEQLRPTVGVSVRRVEKQGNAWLVRGDGAETWTADVVILTCPAHQQAPMLADLDTTLAEEIAAIPYNRIAVVGLGYRAGDIPMALNGFGFIAPQAMRRDLLGVQWCSSIFPARAPAGCILLRAMCGGWQRGDIVDWDDAKLLQALQAELRQAMNIVATPIFQKIIRWHQAIPQYHLGHLDRVARIESQLGQHPGLLLGGNSYRGVSLNDCTEQATLLAQRVHDLLASRPQ